MAFGTPAAVDESLPIVAFRRVDLRSRRGRGVPGVREVPEADEKDFDVMERQTVSIMKACEMCGVSRRTIYNWIAANKVEYLRTAGGGIRIFVDTLWREPDGTKHPTNHTAA